VKDYYGNNATSLQNKKLFLFDIDGMVYLGDTLFKGVPELLQKIENEGAGMRLSRITPPNRCQITLKNTLSWLEISGARQLLRLYRRCGCS
jgi:hypothetical protein